MADIGADIPSGYTVSAYPLQYYFEFRRGNKAWSHPAFNASLSTCCIKRRRQAGLEVGLFVETKT